MNILRRVPGSVLWLLRPSKRLDKNQGNLAEENLCAEAVSRGVDRGRLVFAPRVGKAAHLARHAHASLFLDTFFYGAHSTATDSLRGGCPVLSCAGDSFARRVGVSLLNTAAGPLQRLLLVASLGEFEEVAVSLAADATRKGQPTGISRRSSSSALLDSPSNGDSKERDAFLTLIRRELLHANGAGLAGSSQDSTESELTKRRAGAEKTNLNKKRQPESGSGDSDSDSAVRGGGGSGGQFSSRASGSEHTLFDTARFTCDLERASEAMWEVYQRSSSLSPASIGEHGEHGGGGGGLPQQDATGHRGGNPMHLVVGSTLERGRAL